MPAGVMSRGGQVLDRVAGGGWLEFAGGPAAALAASHLRSPATFTVQLDHLLSSVRIVNHSTTENGTHYRRKSETRTEFAGRAKPPLRRRTGGRPTAQKSE